MRAIRLGLLELLRFRTPMQRAGLAFLASVPLLYGAIYLWSNWDPYGKLSRVPVAVVNQDQPVTVQGRTMDAGDDFVAELRKNPRLGWRYVDSAEAADGLDNGRYYAIITVPPDFTAKLASGATGTPERAAMDIRLDDANNFLVGIMAETVQSELQRQISAAAVTTYFEAAGGQLGKLQKGLTDATAGATKLRDGLATAAKGTHDLASGLGTLKNGTAQLAPGAKQVSAGVSQLTGIAVPLARRIAAGLPILADHAVLAAELADKISAAAADQTQSFAELCDDVVVKLKQLEEAHPWLRDLPSFGDVLTAAEQHQGNLVALLQKLQNQHPSIANDPLFQLTLAIAKNAEATLGGLLAQLAQDHPDLLRDPFFDALVKIAERIATDAHTIADLAEAIHDHVDFLTGKVEALPGKVPALQAKLRNAANNLVLLDNGAKQLATGAQALDKGAGAALTGATALGKGTDALHKGATDLAKGLGSAAGQIPTVNDNAAKTLATPVSVTTSNAHPAGVYGRGLAPFFFAIALWVFGIVAFLLLKPVSGRLLASRAGSVTTAFAAWTPVVFMGAVGAMLLYGVCDLALGLKPVSVLGTAGLMLLGIATFSAIVHWLRLLLGAVGDALALVLLMIQLVSCGGLYPVETLPEPFRTIHGFIPMTYLVKALRITISGGNDAILWNSVAILTAFLGSALALLVGTVALQRTWTMGRLKPELEL